MPWSNNESAKNISEKRKGVAQIQVPHVDENVQEHQTSFATGNRPHFCQTCRHCRAATKHCDLAGGDRHGQKSLHALPLRRRIKFGDYFTPSTNDGLVSDWFIVVYERRPHSVQSTSVSKYFSLLALLLAHIRVVSCCPLKNQEYFNKQEHQTGPDVFYIVVGAQTVC